jgi:cytochrome P450
VVRIMPNELSFASAASNKDIYGQTGAATFVKSTFYKTSNFDASDIIGESDVTVHANMRRIWAHGFSQQALQKHEELEQKYVDLFINQIGKYGDSGKGIDLTEWFNFLTFDIIGELVFGEGFGATKTGKEPYPSSFSPT